MDNGTEDLSHFKKYQLTPNVSNTLQQIPGTVLQNSHELSFMNNENRLINRFPR